MIASNHRYTRICPTVVGLLALLLCLLSVGCSDRILLPDGTIADANGKPVTGYTDPENSTPSGNDPSAGETETAAGNTVGGLPTVLPFGDAAHKMYVEFLNTGKSDCILIRADDTVILVDTADADDYAAISRRLTEYGIDAIDHLILSHYDNDHIGSADQIIEHFTVKTVYMPDYLRQSTGYRRLMAALEASPDTVAYRLRAEDVRLPIGSSDYGSLWINASALYQRGQAFGSDEDNTLTADENDFSLITSVYFGEISLFLPGDAERARMEEFHLIHGALPKNEQRYTLVKTPHHGGYDVGLAAFMDMALPRYAVIATDSADAVDNDLTRKLTVMAVKCYPTYGGDVIFATDGDETRVFQ